MGVCEESEHCTVNVLSLEEVSVLCGEGQAVHPGGHLLRVPGQHLAAFLGARGGGAEGETGRVCGRSAGGGWRHWWFLPGTGAASHSLGRGRDGWGWEARRRGGQAWDVSPHHGKERLGLGRVQHGWVQGRPQTLQEGQAGVGLLHGLGRGGKEEGWEGEWSGPGLGEACQTRGNLRLEPGVLLLAWRSPGSLRGVLPVVLGCQGAHEV